MMEKKEFETFRELGSYELGNLKRDKPSAINFLSYRKSKITIELIDEPNEVLIARLEKMLADPENSENYHRRNLIKDEIKKLSTPNK